MVAILSEGTKKQGEKMQTTVPRKKKPAKATEARCRDGRTTTAPY